MSETFTTQDGIRLHYELRGSGPLVFVCHGGPYGTFEYLAPWLAPLEAHSTLVFWDYRGSGRSDVAPPETYRFERIADDLDELRAHLGCETATVLAHSMGGFITLQYALRHPGRCRALVLIATMPVGRLAKIALPTALALGPLRIVKLVAVVLWYLLAWSWRPESARRIDARGRIWVTLQEPLVPSRATRAARASGSVVENDNAPILQTLWSSYDVTARLAEIAVLALVVVGGADAAFVVGAWILARRLPHASVVKLRGVGHLPFVEEPERTLGPIEAFLDRLRLPDYSRTNE